MAKQTKKSPRQIRWVTTFPYLLTRALGGIACLVINTWLFINGTYGYGGALQQFLQQAVSLFPWKDATNWGFLLITLWLFIQHWKGRPKHHARMPVRLRPGTFMQLGLVFILLALSIALVNYRALLLWFAVQIGADLMISFVAETIFSEKRLGEPIH